MFFFLALHFVQTDNLTIFRRLFVRKMFWSYKAIAILHYMFGPRVGPGGHGQAIICV